MQTAEVPVWDPFVRICHWLLATAVIVAWITDEPLWMHIWLGYLAATLVVLRIVWGLVGPKYARFADFVRGPRLVFGYLVDLMRFSSKRYLGHSPAGGAMILVLLFMVAVTAGTGMATLAAQRGEGPLAGVIAKVDRPDVQGGRDEDEDREGLFIKEVHDTLAHITLMLVALHLAGVVIASVSHDENLVRAMITGRKRPE